MSNIGLRNKLLEKTKKGSFTGWRDRIAKIADQVGINTQYLPVAPDAVSQAQNVISMIQQSPTTLEKLEKLLE